MVEYLLYFEFWARGLFLTIIAFRIRFSAVCSDPYDPGENASFPRNAIETVNLFIFNIFNSFRLCRIT